MPEPQLNLESTPPAAPVPAKFASQISKEAREQYAKELERYSDKDVNELAIDHFKLVRTINERGLIIPNTDPGKGPLSTSEEIAEFNAKMGLPNKAEELDLTADEKALPKDYVEKQLRPFLFQTVGATKGQAKAIVAHLETLVKAGLTAADARRAENEKGYMANLVREFGGDQAAAEAADNLAAKHLASFYSEDSRKEIIRTGLLYNPKFLRDAAAAQAKIEPHGPVLGDPGKGQGAPKKTEQGKQSNYSSEWVRLHGKQEAQ